MEDLISRESLWEHMNQYASKAVAEDIMPNWNDAVSLIGSEPVVDAVRVVHGRWETEEDYDGDTIYVCSVCDCHWVLIDGTPEENDMKFCPQCGADMRG